MAIVTTYQNKDYPHNEEGLTALKAEHPEIYENIFNDKNKQQ